VPNNETTTKFKLDISELVSGMQKAKRQISLANAEFKSATAGMDDWSKSADGINAKLTQLDKTLSSQKSILSNLESQYELTVKQMGEGSKEAENLKIKIENQKASIAKTEKEIRQYSDSLTDVVEAEKIANKTGKTTADVLDDIEDSAKNAGDGFTVFKGAVATFAGNLATSAISGIKDLASNILGLAESTREYRDTMSKLNSAGEGAGYGAEYAKEKYTDLYSVLGDETASSTAVSNFMAMNAEQSTLDSLLNSSIGIWAKYGDSIPLDGLAESVNETAKVGKITGNLADALNWAGINEDAFNEKLEKCTSEQERQRLIADTLNKTYGDLATSYKENNESVIEANKANASYTDAMAQMGAKVEPIMTTIKEGFTQILLKVLELTEGVDFEAIGESIANAFQYFIDEVLPKIVEGLTWIIDNKDILIAGIAGIGTAMLTMNVANMIMGVVKAFKAFKLAQEGATVAQWLLNVAMSANPIGIVIALIVGLVTAFVLLWNKSEGFRKFWINLWDTIKKATSVAVSAIGKFFKDLWENIKNIWKGVSSWYNQKVIQPVVKFFTGMWDKLKNGASDAWAGIKSVFSKVGSFFSETFSKAWQKVKDIFSTGGKIFVGIKDGIVSAFKNIVNSIIRGINKVVSIPFNGINKALRKLRNISILGATPFDWISEINVPQIPELYKGGVLKKGQVGYLEGNGDEAVVPLDHNTGWLDEVASRIVNKGGVAGGKAQTVNNNYNYEFNQTNNSPKPLDRLTIYRQTKNVVNYGLGVS